jgi:TonB family protein
MGMRCKSLFLTACCLLCGLQVLPAMDAPKAFAFVGPQYIITAEVASSRSFMVNFINFSDFVIVVQPNDFIYKAASERMYVGQVYDKEFKSNRGDTYRYSASVLLKGHSFTGLTILGAFREQDQIEELSIRIGAKRYYLQPMERGQFEQIAARVGNLDLNSASPKAELVAANIPEVGTVTTTDGTAEWDRDWKALLKPDGTNPPKLIERPEITPTEEAKRAKAYGRVRLSALITRNGTIQDLRVDKGLGHGMDERITEAILNSWVFLPATRNGEVLEATIYFDVDFPPPATPK